MEPQRAKSWWQRNWLWVVPAGCLGLVLAGVLAVAGIFMLVFSGMRSSDAYSQGVERARTDCAVQEALGAPVKPGWLVSGTINVTGPSGHADLSVPLRGPRGSGTLYVTATKTAGRWRFDRLEVEVAGRSERLDLLAEGRRRCG